MDFIFQFQLWRSTSTSTSIRPSPFPSHPQKTAQRAKRFLPKGVAGWAYTFLSPTYLRVRSPSGVCVPPRLPARSLFLCVSVPSLFLKITHPQGWRASWHTPIPWWFQKSKTERGVGSRFRVSLDTVCTVYSTSDSRTYRLRS